MKNKNCNRIQLLLLNFLLSTCLVHIAATSYALHIAPVGRTTEKKYGNHRADVILPNIVVPGIRTKIKEFKVQANNVKGVLPYTTYGKGKPNNGTKFMENSVLYVKKGGTGDGSSWDNALGEVGDALNIATGNSSITEIWVASGTYYPTVNPVSGSTDDRDKTFAFPARTTDATGLKLYGGFTGTETAISQRNWKTNKTILSGDLDQNDAVAGAGATLAINNHENNAYHVFIGNDYAVIDGFLVVNGGNPAGTTDAVTINGKATKRAHGAGGVISAVAGMKISNTVFYGNNSYLGTGDATSRGGGLYAEDVLSVDINNCVFEKNMSRGGAGIYTFNYASSGIRTIKITNSVFVSNKTGNQDGAAINFNTGSGATINNKVVNCTFYGNHSSRYAGGLFFGKTQPADISNCIFWANTASSSTSVAPNANIYRTTDAGQVVNVYNSLLQGALPAANTYNPYTACITSDPQFTNTSSITGTDGLWMTNDDGLNLKPISDAIKAGHADVVEPANDIVGYQRPTEEIGGNIVGKFTLGAYEFNAALPVALTYFRAQPYHNSAKLMWGVASSLNFNHFEVEKSNNSTHFTKLINVPFRNLGSYTYTDYMPAAGISDGYLYYRLKLVDNDGSFSYSDIRALKISALNDNFNTYPSPFKDKISLNFNVDGSAETIAVLYSADGRAVTVQRLSNSDLTVNGLDDLSSGVYVLSVTNGANSYKVKVIKK